MRCFVGFGSNLGDRRGHLEKAAAEVAALSENRRLRLSPAYETAALVPEGAPSEWSVPYLNTVGEIFWSGSARELLLRLKAIETSLGRAPAERWAPRVIDLDILAMGDLSIDEPGLRVPHAGLSVRSFVLDPLKDLAPEFCRQARKLKTHVPWIMGIVNVTPDSFSDGAKSAAEIEALIHRMNEAGVHAIDIGAESTRPGASPISPEEERRRLLPALEYARELFSGRRIRPYLSVDTRNAETASLAMDYGADCINDVGGLVDPAMVAVLRESACDAVLMHSLTVPADPKVVLPEESDPVLVLKKWLAKRLEELSASGIEPSRLIFDPGIGFGKSPRQSIALLRRIGEFRDLPIRILVGHSRKGFMKEMGALRQRDALTLELSIGLTEQGVDILRVHDFEAHLNWLRSR